MASAGSRRASVGNRHPVVGGWAIDLFLGRETRADGIPFLRPQGVLLYKAKACRPKDDLDLDSCLPLLDARARTWLRDAIARFHPEHRWLALIDQ